MTSDLRVAIRRFRLALALQVGERWLLYLILDAVLVLQGIYVALAEPGDVHRRLWALGFLVPLFGLAMPALGDLLALERRSGCLELALSVPSGEQYFLRRILAVAGIALFQGWGLLTLAWLLGGGGFPILPVLLQGVAVTFLTGATVLFWAVRLREPGGIWLASLATVLLLAPWALANPVPTPYRDRGGAWLPGPWEGLSWSWSFLVTCAAGLLLFAYARRRLRRPETLIG